VDLSYAVLGVSSAQARDTAEIDASCVLERAVELAREIAGSS